MRSGNNAEGAAVWRQICCTALPQKSMVVHSMGWVRGNAPGAAWAADRGMHIVGVRWLGALMTLSAAMSSQPRLRIGWAALTPLQAALMRSWMLCHVHHLAWASKAG